MEEYNTLENKEFQQILKSCIGKRPSLLKYVLIMKHLIKNQVKIFVQS